MRRAPLVAGLIGLLLGPSAHAEEPEGPDELCAELTRLFQAAPRKGSLNVRVMTTWNEAPTIACARKNERAPRRFCRFVPGNMSIEFMSANIRRAQRCLGLKVAEQMSYSMSGSDVVRVSEGVKRPVVVTLTYDTAMRGVEPPYLDISVSRDQ